MSPCAICCHLSRSTPRSGCQFPHLNLSRSSEEAIKRTVSPLIRVWCQEYPCGFPGLCSIFKVQVDNVKPYPRVQWLYSRSVTNGYTTRGSVTSRQLARLPRICVPLFRPTLMRSVVHWCEKAIASYLWLPYPFQIACPSRSSTLLIQRTQDSRSRLIYVACYVVPGTVFSVSYFG